MNVDDEDLLLMKSYQQMMEEIWENWKSEEDKCKGCDGQDEEYPLMFGDNDADIMIVGISPNYSPDCDVDQGTTWSDFQEEMFNSREGDTSNGPWGVIKLIDEKTEYSENDVYFTNAVKCGIESDSDDRETCMKYLGLEIQSIDPEYIIAFGEPAKQALNKTDYVCFEFDKITHNHGTVKREDGRTFIIFAHWSYSGPNGFSFYHYTEPVIDKIEEEIEQK